MRIFSIRKLMLASLLLTGACVSAPKPLYQWGDYQKALLSYTKNPQETQKFADRLKTTIDKAEIQNAVPPGVYAEYGYAMLELNQTPQAVEYFGKERVKWPESAALMTRLIDRLTKASSNSAANPAKAAPDDGRPAEVPIPTPAVPTTTPTNG